MLRETLNTSIGAAALTVDFVTHPQRSQVWLKKAERRGNTIVRQYERNLRNLSKDAGSTLEDLRKNPLALFGIERNGVAGQAPAKARRRVRSRRTRRNGATALTAVAS